MLSIISTLFEYLPTFAPILGMDNTLVSFLHVFMSVCLYIYIHIYLCVCVCECMYVCLFVCLFVCLSVLTYSTVRCLIL